MMKKTKKTSKLKIILLIAISTILALFLLLLLAYYLDRSKQPAAIKNKVNKIAFIRNGNIWTVNPDGSDEKQLTSRVKSEIPVKKFKTCLEDNCGTYDPETWYNRDYYDQLTISPDGSHLAVTSYSSRLEEVIESEDEKLRSQYLAGPYWIPAHLNLHIFNLVTGDTKTYSLESNPLEPAERIDRMYWSKDNSKVYLASVNSRLFSVKISDGSVEQSTVELVVPSSFHYALVPEYDGLVYWSVFKQAGKEGIYGTRLWDFQSGEQKLLSLSNTHSYNSVVSGTNGMAYFWTQADGYKKLFWFAPYDNSYDEMLSMPSCQDGGNSPHPCLALTWQYGGLGSRVTGSVSPTGKYFLGYLNVDFFDGGTGDIYRVSDLAKVFEWGNDYTGLFSWGLDGESLVALRKDGNLVFISLLDGTVKDITHDGGISTFGGFDWNYLN